MLHLREKMCDVHCTSARLTPFSEGHYGNSDMDLVRMQLRGGANRIVALHDMGEGFVKARPVSTTTTLIPSSYMYSNSALHVNAHKGLAIMSNNCTKLTREFTIKAFKKYYENYCALYKMWCQNVCAWRIDLHTAVEAVAAVEEWHLLSVRETGPSRHKS